MVVTYSSINTNSFDGYGEMVMGSKGTMIVSQEKEILLYKEAGNAYTSRADDASRWRPWARSPSLETSPSLAGPSTASALGTPGHGRSLARLSRRARAFRLLHPPRQRLELPRRQGPSAPLPRRGRPGRRRHRADHQHRHARRTAGSSSTPGGSTTPRKKSPKVRRRSRGGCEYVAQWMTRFPADLPSAVFIQSREQ